MKTTTRAERDHPLLKIALEMGPLVVFFLSNNRWDLFVATAAFMAATAVSLAASYWVFRRMPLMPLVSGVIVLVFGGLTLWLQDDLFIKLKPTIVNLLFATTLLVGLVVFRIPLLGYVLDAVLELDADGWRKLTLRWGLFFVFLAALNEVVWRTASTDFWVAFKVFGVMPITLAFALAQYPLIRRHQVEAPAVAE